MMLKSSSAISVTSSKQKSISNKSQVSGFQSHRTGISKGSKYAQESKSIAQSKYATKLVSPWCLEYKFDLSSIPVPKAYAFEDYRCEIPKKHLDLNGHLINRLLMETIRIECGDMVRSLILDDTDGLTIECFKELRGGLSQLRRLSLIRTEFLLNKNIGSIIGSFQSLVYLNISDCDVNYEFFRILSLTAKNVKILIATNCTGIEDFSLSAISQWIQKHRQLACVNLSYNKDIEDNGVMDLLNNGYNILTNLNLTGCNKLTNSSLTTLRNKNPSIKKLFLNNLLLSSSVYEWITEGCRSIQTLHIAQSVHLSDDNLFKIGRYCWSLESLDISNCLLITDQGIEQFFSVFEGKLLDLNLSGCIKCGNNTAIAISSHFHTVTSLKSLRLNGLARIETVGLIELWNQLSSIEEFEMCANLKSVTTHRRSMMPHLSDVVIKSLKNPPSTIKKLKLIGAFQITDIGASILIQSSFFHLNYLDVSYCYGITDQLLSIINEFTYNLKTILCNGCINITTKGLIILCSGNCSKILEHLEFNGCAKIMDPGIAALSNCFNLKILSIRNCDHITNEPLLKVASSCLLLISLDISNLDYVGLPVVQKFIQNCPNLKKFCAEGCNFTPMEFFQLCKPILPFATPCKTQCKLEPYPKPIINFNKYVQQIKIFNDAAKKIQKFSRFIISTYLLRLAKKMKRKRFYDLKRSFEGLKIACYKQKQLNRLHSKHQDAADLQYCMRRLLAIHYGRCHARYLRKERDARLLLQRCIRGFLCRNRIQRITKRLYIYYNYIGHLVHKYWIITAARKLHSQLLLIQAFGRRIPHCERYKNFYYSLKVLQKKWKKYFYFLKKQKEKEQKQLQEKKLIFQQQNNAAFIIQKNWKATFFNKSMAPYILTCCVYWRTEDDENQYYSTIIQRYWRGFIIRLKIWRKSYNYYLINKSASLIAAEVKRYQQQQKYKKILPFYCKVIKNWKRYLYSSRPRLRLGFYVRKIQRVGLLYLFNRQRYEAASDLQRIIRGRLARHIFKEMIKTYQSKFIIKIQRKYRKHYWKNRRYEMFARQRMAALKLGTYAEKFFIPQRLQTAKINENKKINEVTLREKKELLLRKRIRIMDSVRIRYHHVMACRIQKGFRDYKERQRIKNKSSSLSAKGIKKTASLKELSARSSRKLAIPKIPKVLNPIKAAKGIANSIPNPFGSVDLIKENEREKFENAVLKYQIKSILQEGVVNIRLTLGDLEFKSFDTSQRQLANNHLPHFIKVPGDLSGTLQLKMYLWVEYGSGRECICQLKVEEKPSNTSQAGMKVRQQRLYDVEHIKLAWHPHINFEIQGECSVKQGKGDFAIQQIKITENDQESDELEGSDYNIVKELNEYGMHSIIWCSSRRLKDEENLYKYSQAATYSWWDERLFRIAKGFVLSEKEIFSLRTKYEEILSGRLHPIIKIQEFFIALDYPYNQIAKWIVDAIQTSSTKELTFSEYVHLLSYFIMFSPKNLDRFIFQQMDVDHKDYLRRDQFSELMEILAEGSPFNVKVWQYQWDQYHDRKLGFMFVTHFEEFLHQNPGALWQAQSLQRKMMKHALGTSYWEKKMEQYRTIREELQIKLL